MLDFGVQNYFVHKIAIICCCIIVINGPLNVFYPVLCPYIPYLADAIYCIFKILSSHGADLLAVSQGNLFCIRTEFWPSWSVQKSPN